MRYCLESLRWLRLEKFVVKLIMRVDAVLKRRKQNKKAKRLVTSSLDIAEWMNGRCGAIAGVTTNETRITQVVENLSITK